MSKTRILVLALAIGSAILAAILAKGLLHPAPAPVVKVKQQPVQHSVKVLVSNNNLKMGDPVKEGQLSWKGWPQSNVLPYMVTQKAKPNAISDLVGARARMELFEGEPVSEKKLVMPGSAGFMAAILPKGMRAVAVRISVETGAGGFILPNDRVDVMLTRKRELAGKKDMPVTRPILQNVRVLAIDQLYRENEKGEKVKVGSTATLELEPYMTEVLAMSESIGQLSLALRSLADNGDSALGDDGPRLAGPYADGGDRTSITVYRYGKPSIMGATE